MQARASLCASGFFASIMRRWRRLRFKLDENLHRDAMAPFRVAGHDVESALDEQLGGQSDAIVFAACQRETRILVTLDLDFADIRRYAPSEHAGIWVLRPSTQSITHLLERGG